MSNNANSEWANPIISRRGFTLALASLACMPQLSFASQAAATISPEQAKEIYRRSIVIDCLCGLDGGDDFSSSRRQQQFQAIKESGLTAINLTVGVGEYTDTKEAIAYWLKEIRNYSSNLLLVEKHADIERAKRENRLGIILGFQDGKMLGQDVMRVDEFFKLGVRIIQPTYNIANLIGDGCLEKRNAGLSNFGREVVRRMGELRMALDLSHCGDQTTTDAIALSSRPALITHSGCREVFRHPRNKEDRELRAMAQRGGVLGIYLMPYLGGTDYATEELLLRHIEHALNVCGKDHVGIGTDQSVMPVLETPEYMKRLRDVVIARKQAGIAAPGDDRPLHIKELNYPRRLEGVAVSMAKRGHSSEVIEKVIGGNFHRVFREIWN
ncbi:MAG: membrane dipeptidase [Blastocatellia bacterium]